MGARTRPPTHFARPEFRATEDAGTLYQLKRDFNEVYRRRRDLEESRSLHPEIQAPKDRLENDASRMPIPDRKR